MYKLRVFVCFAFLHLVLSGTRPVEAESGVVSELADERVGGGTESNGKDETDGKKLDGDLLEGADALGDGVRWKALLELTVPLEHYGDCED